MVTTRSNDVQPIGLCWKGLRHGPHSGSPASDFDIAFALVGQSRQEGGDGHVAFVTRHHRLDGGLAFVKSQ